MRPIDSAYDRAAASEEGDARKIYETHPAGTLITHETLDTLGDMGKDYLRKLYRQDDLVLDEDQSDGLTWIDPAQVQDDNDSDAGGGE